MVNITTRDERLHLIGPYNSDLPAAAKRLGGKWDPDNRSWHFDPRDEARVRALAVDIYGTDGSPVETVTVQVDCHRHAGYRRIELAGRVVLEKRTRDERPRLGDGVIHISGSFVRSSGSMRYPTIGENDAVIEVRDVPRAAVPDSVDGYTIIEPATIDVTALRVERERLLARLAEIDAQLTDD